MNHLPSLSERSATELEAIAANTPGGGFPLRICTAQGRAALAAEALWLFAQKTGLDQEGEAMETVIVDFMANLLHLCRLTGIITAEENHFPTILQTAEMHVELDEEEGEHNA